MSAARLSAPNTVSPLVSSRATNSRVTAAVERALDDRQREATQEVERILAAAVRVMERVAPEPPRVSDIVAEAGSSNKAFYRYFAGKDDVILAVMERGVAIVVSYLQHQMTKEPTPAGQLRRWIEGALAQVKALPGAGPPSIGVLGVRRPLGAIPAVGIGEHRVAVLAAEQLPDRHAQVFS